MSENNGSGCNLTQYFCDRFIYCAASNKMFWPCAIDTNHPPQPVNGFRLLACEPKHGPRLISSRAMWCYEPHTHTHTRGVAHAKHRVVLILMLLSLWQLLSIFSNPRVISGAQRIWSFSLVTVSFRSGGDPFLSPRNMAKIPGRVFRIVRGNWTNKITHLISIQFHSIMKTYEQLIFFLCRFVNHNPNLYHCITLSCRAILTHTKEISILTCYLAVSDALTGQKVFRSERVWQPNLHRMVYQTKRVCRCLQCVLFLLCFQYSKLKMKLIFVPWNKTNNVWFFFDMNCSFRIPTD